MFGIFGIEFHQTIRKQEHDSPLPGRIQRHRNLRSTAALRKLRGYFGHRMENPSVVFVFLESSRDDCPELAARTFINSPNRDLGRSNAVNPIPARLADGRLP